MPGPRRAGGAPRGAACSERGAAAVELALVLPILLLLIFGIVEFGRGYQAKAALTSAVREGARSLAIGVGNPTAVVASAAPLLHANQLTVTTSASPCLTGTQATVTATYPFTYNIPFFPAATVTLSATGAMLCEQ